MRKLKIPVITEGKYDKIKLSGVIDAHIITTNGFGVFKSEEKKALIRTLGKNGIVILCDSDGGGKIIRSHLKGLLGGIKTYDLYIPQLKGRERRKKEDSKAGFLGVEGVPNEVLTSIFDSFYMSHPELFDDVNPDFSVRGKKAITTADMYSLGLTGGENSSLLRDKLAKKLSLPAGMNSKGLCEAMVLLGITSEDAKNLLNQEE